MLILISPSKTLSTEQLTAHPQTTRPDFLQEAAALVKPLRKLKVDRLMALMAINPKLAQLTQDRFFCWSPDPLPEASAPALLAYRGEVYHGLDAATFTLEEMTRAQQQLRILSGLYGVLRPLDRISPYRLEMGAPFAVGKAKNLYDFWQRKITAKIAEALQTHQTKRLINLASVEYFKVLDLKKLKVEVITPEFLEGKNGGYQMVTVYAKKARGLMTRFIIQNRIEEPEQLQAFDLEGYTFNPHLTRPGRPVFTRG